MIDQATVDRWLQNVTHRPGWEIKSGGRYGEHSYIVIWFTETDTNTSEGGFRTAPLFRIPEEIGNQEQFLDWILDVCIPGIDTHERWEWFRVNGRKWRDPHAAGMPAFATDFEAREIEMCSR